METNQQAKKFRRGNLAHVGVVYKSNFAILTMERWNFSYVYVV